MLGGVTVPAPAGCLSSRWHKEERAEQAGDFLDARQQEDWIRASRHHVPAGDTVPVFCGLLYGMLPYLMGGIRPPQICFGGVFL